MWFTELTLPQALLIVGLAWALVALLVVRMWME